MSTMRVLWLVLGSVLLAASILSTQLASSLGYWGMLVVVPTFAASWWLYFKASFPPRLAELEDAPDGVEHEVDKWVTSRASLVVGLSIVAMFAPVWAWILPLFGLQAAYRASKLPGDFTTNCKNELKNAARYLGLTAVNIVFFALTLVTATVTALGSFAWVYYH